MDKERHRELFGSDSEYESDEPAPSKPADAEAADADNRSRPGVGEEDLAEGELFGSGSDASEAEPSAAAEPPAVPSAPPLHFELPQCPKPTAGASLYLVRLPNILSFQPRPFEPETFEEELEADDEGERRIRTDNVIRWRDGGEGLRLSNTRLARWSDGSMTLHVGAEVLAAQQIEPHKSQRGAAQLFVRHKGSNLECQGVLHKKLTFQPASIDSATHRALTKQIAQSHVKERKIKITATLENPEKLKLEKEKIWEEEHRLEARRAARRERDTSGPEISADFLDADDEALEGDLGAVRKQFKNKRKFGAGMGGARRPAGLGVRKKARRNKADEDEEDEEDEDEDDEGDPREMDDFIVEDEDEAEESEEGSD